VRAEPLDAAARVLGALDGIELVDGEIDARAAQVNRLLVEAGIAVSELGRRQASLEDVFLELTGDDR
jgi:ABC-2 type transport system ATP-binding protein